MKYPFDSLGVTRYSFRNHSGFHFSFQKVHLKEHIRALAALQIATSNDIHSDSDSAMSAMHWVYEGSDDPDVAVEEGTAGAVLTHDIFGLCILEGQDGGHLLVRYVEGDTVQSRKLTSGHMRTATRAERADGAEVLRQLGASGEQERDHDPLFSESEDSAQQVRSRDVEWVDTAPMDAADEHDEHSMLGGGDDDNGRSDVDGGGNGVGNDGGDCGGDGDGDGDGNASALHVGGSDSGSAAGDGNVSTAGQAVDDASCAESCAESQRSDLSCAESQRSTITHSVEGEGDDQQVVFKALTATITDEIKSCGLDPECVDTVFYRSLVCVVM